MVCPLALRIDSFAKLSREDRAAIDRISRSTREIAARRDLAREGDAPRYVHLILEGWAARYKTLPDGRRQIVAFFVPGDFCDLNIYILKAMDHNIGAITRLKVADIGPDEMEALTTTHPRVTQALWWQELVNGSIQREWTLNVGQRSAHERIAHLLVEMYLRLECVGLTRDQSCDFPLTQNDLADATGLTAVHVNRTLQELRRAGLIVLQGRTLTILDLNGLKNAGLFNDNYLHLHREGRHLDAND
jgi:CRP-like cAMP-binding protein